MGRVWFPSVVFHDSDNILVHEDIVKLASPAEKCELFAFSLDAEKANPFKERTDPLFVGFLLTKAGSFTELLWTKGPMLPR